MKTFIKKETFPKQPEYHPEIVPQKISDVEKEKLEAPITKEELDIALGKSKNNKSPRLDGYSPEFYKFFWPQLGDFFLECINSNFKRGELTCTQSQGVITCLPIIGQNTKSAKKLETYLPAQYIVQTYLPLYHK